MRSVFEPRRGLPDDEKMLAEYNAKVARDEAKFKAGLDKLHANFGLKMPTVSTTGQVVEIEKAPAAEVMAPSEPTAAHDKDDASPADTDPDSEATDAV